MSPARRKPQEDLDVQLRIDDAQLDQLAELTGQRVVRCDVWEDTVFDAFDHASLAEAAADIDVYLEAGARFELFAVITYPDPNDDPLEDVGEVARRLDGLIVSEAVLEDVAVDTEDDLVLILSARQETLYLNAAAWSIDEWEELPD